MDSETTTPESLIGSLQEPVISISTTTVSHEVGLAGLVERQLMKYIHAERQIFPTSGLYDRVLNEVERPLLRVVLDLVKGNKIQAAQILGLNRNTLLRKLRQHGLYQEKSTKQRRKHVV